jgi:hypothetical protein
MKRIIPYPLLFITAIVLDRVVISLNQIDMGQSLRALFILLLLTTITSFVIQYVRRDWHYTNFIILMIWAALIAYRSLYGLLKVKFPEQAYYLGFALMPCLGIMFGLVISQKVWRSVRNPARVTYYFSLVFTLLLCFQVVRLAKGFYHVLMTANHPQSATVPTGTDNIHLQKKKSPDIYVIVLDGYARQDVLQNLYQHDNSEFIHQLEKRGFFVANNSHSNYIQTLYSMASFWNFDYLPSMSSPSDFIHYLHKSIQNNQAFRLLDGINYTTVSFEGETDYTEIQSSDVYFSNFLPINRFEGLLLADSPLEPLSDTFDLALPIPTYKNHRQRIHYEFETLKEIPISIPGPKIVYAHILAPHPPFVFDQNGNTLQNQQAYSLWDDSQYRGGYEEYWKGYGGQVTFVNKEIIKVIDAILAKSEMPPVILLMSDHGPASMFNWDLNTPSCLWERTSNLYAILLPEHLNSEIVYSSITPVNTFRVIFNTYFGTNLPYLDDKSYLMTWQQPTVKVDMTDARDTGEGCTISENQKLGD